MTETELIGLIPVWTIKQEIYLLRSVIVYIYISHDHYARHHVIRQNNQ